MSEKDIVKRLTHAAYAPTKASNSDVINGKINSQLLTDAAAEITRLRSLALAHDAALEKAARVADQSADAEFARAQKASSQVIKDVTMDCHYTAAEIALSIRGLKETA